MIGEPRRRAGPEEVGEVVAGEPLAGFEGEANEERQMLPRAEADLLPGGGEQGRTT